MKINMGIPITVLLGLIGMLVSGYLIHWGTKKAAEKRIEIVRSDIKLSKEEIIEHYTNLDEKSKKEVIDKLFPEFQSVKDEIGYSQDEIIDQFYSLSDTKQKELFDKISPEFQEVKKEINLSNNVLFERIRKMDRGTKDEILKIVKPQLELNPQKTKIENLQNGLIQTTYVFEVPGNYQIPENYIKIEFDSNINSAKILRKQFRFNNTLGEASYENLEKENGVQHKVINLGMNENIHIVVTSKAKLIVVNLEVI